MKWKILRPEALKIAGKFLKYSLFATGSVYLILLVLPNAVGMAYSFTGLPFYNAFCGPPNTAWFSTFQSVPIYSEGYYAFMTFDSSRESCKQDYRSEEQAASPSTNFEQPTQPASAVPLPRRSARTSGASGRSGPQFTAIGAIVTKVTGRLVDAFLEKKSTTT